LDDRILVVDDDEAIVHMMEKLAVNNGMRADTAYSGEQALKMLEAQPYSLMLLDINMQGMDGFEVIERVRRTNSGLPIMVVSGRKEDVDTLYALRIGADDYITKPFNPVTLGAKAKALIRRSRIGEEPEKTELVVGPFVYKTSTLRLYKNGVEIELTGKENALIKLFMDNVNRVFPKEVLYDMVWGNALVDENTVTVYINHLRQKIEDVPSAPRYLQTVRGLGYRFTV